jgi:hypothetical protein
VVEAVFTMAPNLAEMAVQVVVAHQGKPLALN